MVSSITKFSGLQFSALILGVSSEIAWIPACAGTTETGVNFQTTISKPLGLTEGGLIWRNAQTVCRMRVGLRRGKFAASGDLSPDAAGVEVTRRRDSGSDRTWRSPGG